MFARVSELTVFSSFAVRPVVKMIVDKGPGDHVPIGRIVSIRCTATGFPQPSLEMKKDSAPVHSAKRPRENEIVLTLDDVQPADAGQYVCVASNIADVDRSFTSITVRCKYTYVKKSLEK